MNPDRCVVAVIAGTADVPLASPPDGCELRFITAREQLAADAPDADVVFAWDPRRDWLQACWGWSPRLRWIAAASAGVDQLLFPELVASDVILTNSAGVFDAAMAEYALALAAAVCADLPATIRLQARRQWLHRQTRRLAGGTAGLLPAADFVVLALPLTPATERVIGASELALMRPDAWLVNLGRGGLVDETALVRAASAGTIGGAALDVFATEPLPADSPLWTLPNVIVSPHMSGDARGWETALTELFSAQLERYRSGRPLRNVVDKHLGFVPGIAP